jgi:hypothetical protein
MLAVLKTTNAVVHTPSSKGIQWHRHRSLFRALGTETCKISLPDGASLITGFATQ